MLTIDDVLRGVESARLEGTHIPGLAFGRVTQDSRLVQSGDLFVALRGERDGHDFVQAAVRLGARGAIVDHVPDRNLGSHPPEAFAYVVVPDTLLALQQLAAYWLAKHPITSVAVTGSVGKTTTKETIALVLAQGLPVLKSERNFNNEIGLPLSVLTVNRHHRVAVFEMGMYALGEIATLCRIVHPTIGVVTNVGPSHMERLGTLDRIAEAKSELVRALPADGFAILNGDDAFVREMSKLTRARTVLFGTGEHCGIRAMHVKTHGLEGIEFEILHQSKTMHVSSPMPGFHSIYACLAAAAVGLCTGLSWQQIKQGLAAKPADLRTATVPGRFGATIIDDTYNASPSSVKGALELLAQLPGRRIAILGDMLELGSFEEEGHRQVGRCAAASVDTLVVVGPRARWIGDEAISHGLSDVAFARDKDEVDVELGRGDYVLVKGSRGMHMEEIVERLREPNAKVN